jgi:hypothetical protein
VAILHHKPAYSGRVASEKAPRPALTLFNLNSVEIVASPFSSFREVGRFQQALSDIPSVQAVHLRRLQHGVLQVRIEYRSSSDLLDALCDAFSSSFSFRVLSHEAHRIEIVFADEADTGQEVRWAP